MYKLAMKPAFLLHFQFCSSIYYNHIHCIFQMYAVDTLYNVFVALLVQTLSLKCIEIFLRVLSSYTQVLYLKAPQIYRILFPAIHWHLDTKTLFLLALIVVTWISLY